MPSDGRGKWMALLAAFLGWMFDGLEIGLWPMIGRPALAELMGQPLSSPTLDKVIGPWFGGIIALFLLGAAAGGFIFGRLGDRIGRVRAMIWSVLCYSIFSGLCAVAAAPWQLGALRFVASMGMGGEWALGVSLVMEVWPSGSRPLMAGLIGAAANVGFLIVGYLGLFFQEFTGGLGNLLKGMLPADIVDALLAYNAWRMLCVVGALPALLTFLIRLFVPESEKWQQATRAAPTAPGRLIFAAGIRRHTILGACLAGLALMGTWASVQWIPSWVAKMTTAQPELNARVWAQIWMAYGAITCTIVVALLAERFNRRIAYFGICAGSLIVCQYLFLAKPPYGSWFLLVASLANGVTAGFYGWLPLYLPELFPTRIRATGSGFSFNIGRVIAAAGALWGGQLLTAFGGDYPRMCSTICWIYALGLVLIWFCPETKGKPLPD